VPKAEAAATTGAGDSYNDVPKLLRQFHVTKINELKKKTIVQAAHSIDGPRAELHTYQLQPIDGITMASHRS
jgi:hypothetical protein